MIFMEIMPLMLNLEEPSNEFAKFFIDSAQSDLNLDNQGSRFTVPL
jgi:hypothetical protein